MFLKYLCSALVKILEDLDFCGTAGVLQRELAVHTSAVKGLEWTTGKFLVPKNILDCFNKTIFENASIEVQRINHANVC
jgi:hypothetical protein